MHFILQCKCQRSMLLPNLKYIFYLYIPFTFVFCTLDRIFFCIFGLCEIFNNICGIF